MLKPLTILGLAIAFTGCATTSQNETTSTNSNQKQEKVAKEESEEKYICRRTATVGSHFRKKKCWTAEEYAKRKEEDRRTMESVRDRQLGGSLPVENK